MKNPSTRPLPGCLRLARRLAAALCLSAAAGAAAQTTAERPPTAASMPPAVVVTLVPPQTPAAGAPAQPVPRPSTASVPAPAPSAVDASARSPSSAVAAPARLPPPALAASPRVPLPAVAAAAASRSAAPAAEPVITLSPPASAVAAPPSALPDGIEQQVRQLALDGTRSLAAAPAAAAAGRPPLRIEVLVGALDPRLRLAPCQRIEPYLNAGSRLWGASRVGLRCVDGAARWNVFLPVTVKVHGRALVAVSALPAGSVLAASDLALAEVDLAEDASAALVDGTLAAGRTLQRALSAGQSLRQSHLKPRQWFAAGDTVQVLANGDGFRVSGEAVALTRGVEGEAARVRTDSGRVLTGMPAAERRVDLPQ